jgi:hypothetical protein
MAMQLHAQCWHACQHSYKPWAEMHCSCAYLTLLGEFFGTQTDAAMLLPPGLV